MNLFAIPHVVLFPKLIKALRSRILIIKEYEYFKDLVLNVVKQRSTTSEVFSFKHKAFKDII
jgi:hypothetical protein